MVMGVRNHGLPTLVVVFECLFQAVVASRLHRSGEKSEGCPVDGWCRLGFRSVVDAQVCLAVGYVEVLASQSLDTKHLFRRSVGIVPKGIIDLIHLREYEQWIVTWLQQSQKVRVTATIGYPVWHVPIDRSC